MMIQRDEIEGAEHAIDNRCSNRHRDIEGDKQERGHLQSIIFSVDVQNRQNDQVRENEGDDTAEQHSSCRRPMEWWHKRTSSTRWRDLMAISASPLERK